MDRTVALTGVVLTADVAVPEGAHGVVLFAHGSGSSRRSPRNRRVADALHGAGLGTVLADLLTPDEEELDARTGELRFDIDRLAARMTGLVDWVLGWLAGQPGAAGLGVGLFGASTGAAAALVAAAERPADVRAVVSRGGRPDLAGDRVERVRQPTLLIVGQRDPAVLELNRAALARLPGERRLVIVPGASHLFDEPGTLLRVADLARDWFLAHR